jgi:hypothetical protein
MAGSCGNLQGGSCRNLQRRPLYTYVGDNGPAHTNGNNINLTAATGMTCR